MTRQSPLPPAEWPESMRAALAALRPAEPTHPFPPADPSRPKGLNALGFLAHHPTLTKAWNTFNGHILFGSTITPRQRELLVLRVAHRRRAEYEWVQHTVLAGDAGITPEEIERVQLAADAQGWDAWLPLDAALVAAADELIDDARVSDATWTVLAAELDQQQLMDVVFTVGAYDLLAMAFRTFDVGVDQDLLDRVAPTAPGG
jgi:alkylhydroperoxidase family enzyme